MGSAGDRVLFVTNAWPDAPGSVRGWFVRSLAQRLGNAGIDVDVVTERVYAQSPKWERERFGEVFRVPSPLSGERLLAETRGIPVARVSWWLAACFARGLAELRARRHCIIHAHWAVPAGVVGAGLAQVSRRPFVLSVHGSDVTRFPPGSPGWRAVRFALRQATRVICNSEFTASAAREAGVEERRLSVLPCVGVDTTRFRPAPSAPTQPVVLFVAGLHEHKRPLLLLEAFARLRERHPTAQLHFAGDGPLRSQLEAEITRLGIGDRVRLLGAVPHDAIDAHYRAATVFALPSRREGMGLSVLEAMSSGVPVLACREGGVLDLVVDGETGLLVAPDDVSACCDALDRLLSDAELRTQLGRAGRARCEAYFESAGVAAAYAELYAEL